MIIAHSEGEGDREARVNAVRSRISSISIVCPAALELLQRRRALEACAGFADDPVSLVSGLALAEAVMASVLLNFKYCVSDSACS